MRQLDLLARSPALWNRSKLDLRSDEILAQILERGTLEDWRALDALAREDVELRDRIVRLVAEVPMYLPHFWLAAMSALGAAVDWSVRVPEDGGIA